MKQYLELLVEILETGKPKKTRGHNTLGLFALNFDFDLSTGKFPLLTTRKMGMKSIAAELFCFIHGVTSKRTFRDAGTTIWDEWCNPTKASLALAKNEEERKDIMAEEDDLGPIYGFQWRHFGQPYHYVSDNHFGHRLLPNSHQATDQLQRILTDLKENPHSRRMVCSAWCPTHEHMQALPPCHVAWNLVCYGDTLNLFWHQRSCDMVLGVPYNVASYALLLLLLCKHSGLKPGRISGKLVDAHIYIGDNNPNTVCHRQGLIEQFKRRPKSLPSLRIPDRPGSTAFDIFEWKPTDLELLDYDPHPPIKFQVAV